MINFNVDHGFFQMQKLQVSQTASVLEKTGILDGGVN